MVSSVYRIIAVSVMVFFSNVLYGISRVRDMTRLLEVNQDVSELPSSRGRECKIAVRNSRPAHLETLESIAFQLPEERLAASGCQSYVFDYHTLDVAKVKSWADYCQKSMKGKSRVVDNKKHTVRDHFMHKNIDDGLDLQQYDAVVEASCYCDHVTSLQESDSLTCVFHQTCTEVAQHPRAVWLSPHHEQYYLPTYLPEFENLPIHSPKTTICTVGGTKRRNWDLMKTFLDTYEGKQDIQLLIVGGGPFPAALGPDYVEMTNQVSPEGFEEFHMTVAYQCSIIVALVTPSRQEGYFHSGLRKLTGSVPLIVAYNKPAVLHNELGELYRDYIPHMVTHGEDSKSFNDAMTSIIHQVKLDSS